MAAVTATTGLSLQERQQRQQRQQQPSQFQHNDINGVSGQDDPHAHKFSPEQRLRIETSAAEKQTSATGHDGHLADETDDYDEARVDQHQSEDDDDEADSARNAISVSISCVQTRLTSPKTPAVEKQLALDRAGGFFFGELDVHHEADEDEVMLDLGDADADIPHDEDDDDNKNNSAAQDSNPSKPIPERAHSPEMSSYGLLQHEPRTRSSIFASLPFTRKRAGTVDATHEKWHRSLLASLPSIHRKSSSTSLGSISGRDDEVASPKSSQDVLTRRSQSQRPECTHTSSEKLQRIAPDDTASSEAQIGEIGDMPDLHSDGPRPGLLRRSTSVGSLDYMRRLSHVPSLGDDERWVNTQAQVNSRFKALKDTWQDSGVRLTNTARNLSAISFTSDLLRERSSSLGSWRPSRRESMSDGNLIDGENGKQSRRPDDPMTRQAHGSIRTAANEVMDNSKHPNHPHLHRALRDLEGDIVVLGGYRGSILRSAEPPHRQLWVPVKVGLNLRKVNLEVGFEEEAVERATKTIIPDGMLTHIGPVDISRRLFKRLRSCENARHGKLRVHDFGYDWRLHPHHLSQQLSKFLRSLSCNRPGVPKEQRGAIVIAHSLGGLITRHAVNQHPELFSGVVYAGVPRTCVNILGPLRNGDEVLLSSRVLTAQVNFSIRTSFALLPLDGRCFIDKDTKEEYRLDFFDPQTWIDYRLSPCIARPLPPLNPVEKPSGIAGYVTSVTNVLPNLSLPGKKSGAKTMVKRVIDRSKAVNVAGATEPASLQTGNNNTNNVEKDHGAALNEKNDMTDTNHEASQREHSNEQNNTSQCDDAAPDPPSNDKQVSSISTHVTVPYDIALDYLTRTLATVKQFKQELSVNPSYVESNVYPPLAVIYGKSVPTVYGARVAGREGIKHSDAYDDLAFASGDGVVLARASMVPPGYSTVKGGVVSSERGHVTLLGDLEAVGKCLIALERARKDGVGLGERRPKTVP